MRKELLQILAATAKTIVVAVLLGEAITALSRIIMNVRLPWPSLYMIAAPSIVHMAILIASWTISRKPDIRLVPHGAEPRDVWKWLAIAGPVWLCFVTLGPVISTLIFPWSNSGPRPLPGPSWWVATILVAPVLEEFVYRGLISPALRRDCGNIAGSYLAAVLFAWVHARPTVAGILSGSIGAGIFLGPLLLGLVAEWLYVKNRSIWVPVAFHAACNLTPLVFSTIDPRWLGWLGRLYQ